MTIHAGKTGGKPPSGEQQHRALPYALPGCYDCHDGTTPDSKLNPNPCKTAPEAPGCDRTKMTDDYCASLCLHWAQTGKIPGAASDEIYSGTQYAYTCWCGTATDAAKLVSVDDKQCNTPCEGDKSMMCGGPNLNHVMRVTCSRWGWSFVQAFIACSFGYLLIGALYTSRTRGVPLTKAEFVAGSLLPHRPFWNLLRDLTTDGVRFCRAKLRGDATDPARGYQSLGQTETLGRRDSGGKSSSRCDESSVDERHSSKGSGSKKKRAKETHRRTEAEGNSQKRGGGSKHRGDPQEHPSTEESHTRGADVVGSTRELTEQREAEGGLHASQAKIKVVGINAR